MFFSLFTDKLYRQGEVWSSYFDTVIHEDFITDVLIFSDQKFFVTAHNSGDIHLRKLSEFKSPEFEFGPKAAQKSSKSIHVFKGHSRRVTSLKPIQGKSTSFVSASLDGKLRIWCIEKMIELYCFDIAIDSPV